MPGRSRGASGTSAVLLGGVAGQGALALASPLLSRIFTPAELGVYASAAALAAVAASVAGGRFDQAIPRASTTEEAVALAQLARNMTIVVAVGAGALWLRIAETAEPRIAVGVCLITASGALFQARSFAGMRTGDLGRLGAARGVQGISTAVGQLLASVGGRLGVLALVAGDAFGRAAGTLAAPRLPRTPRATLGEQRRAGAAHRLQLTVMTPAVLVNMLSVQLPLLAATRTIGEDAAGQFALAVRVVYAPAALLASAIAAQFYSAASEAARSDASSVGALTRRYAAFAGQFAAPLAAGAAVVAPAAFPVLFGARWAEAGRLAVPIAAWAAVTLVGSSVAGVMVLTGNERAALRLTALDLTFTTLGVTATALLLGDGLTFAALVSGASLVAGVVSITRFIRSAGPATDDRPPIVGPLLRGWALAAAWLLPLGIAIHGQQSWLRAVAALLVVAAAVPWLRHLWRQAQQL